MTEATARLVATEYPYSTLLVLLRLAVATSVTTLCVPHEEESSCVVASPSKCDDDSKM